MKNYAKVASEKIHTSDTFVIHMIKYLFGWDSLSIIQTWYLRSNEQKNFLLQHKAFIKRKHSCSNKVTKLALLKGIKTNVRVTNIKQANNDPATAAVSLILTLGLLRKYKNIESIRKFIGNSFALTEYLNIRNVNINLWFRIYFSIDPLPKLPIKSMTLYSV